MARRRGEPGGPRFHGGAVHRAAPRIVARLAAPALLGLAGCATAPSGPPLADPGALARRLAVRTPPEPALLRFQWHYEDLRGGVGGEGAGRYEPPDSLRLDLFSSGDVSMGVALVPGRLSTLGQIEDVRLPAAPFLFGLAGIFRPGPESPARGFQYDDGDVLGYEVSPGVERLYFVRKGRLTRIEERAGGRVRRRVTLRWADESPWPEEAEYRDFVDSRRVTWHLTRVEAPAQPFAGEIYDLPDTP